MSNTEMSNTEMSNTEMSNTEMSNTEMSNTEMSNTEMSNKNKGKIPLNFNVAGVSFYKKTINSLLEGDILYLEKDPKNKYDTNAVKILKDNSLLGHVPKDFNKVILKRFEKIQTKYVLKVKTIHKWDGPTGVEVQFYKNV